MAEQGFQVNGNQENSSRLINMTQFQDEFFPFQLDSTKNENQNKESHVFSDSYIELKTLPSSLISPEKNKKNQKSVTDNNNSFRQSFNKDQSQHQNQHRDKQNVKLKKRKHQTEPNSPTHISGEHQNNGGQQSSNRTIILNNQIVIGREMPIRMSGNKLNIIRGPQQNGVVANKNKYKKQQQDSLLKLNNSLDDQQSIADFFNGNNQKQDIQETGYQPQTDEKNSSFLPRLDINHRYSNSQVQYREPNDLNRSDVKDVQNKADTTLKQTSNTWINESFHASQKKASFSLERKNPHIQVQQSVNDFNQSGRGPQIKNGKGKNLKTNNYNTSTNLFNEISPQNNNMKEFSELYQLKNGIGKIQPVPEIKIQFNEQVIRGKIYREKNLNSETPQKVDMNLISIGKSSHIPHSEITSPSNNMGSPLNFQFESNKPIKGVIQNFHLKGQVVNTDHLNERKQSKTRMLNISELSEDFNMLNDKLQNVQTQFQYRNYSISQGSSKQEPHEIFHSQVPQYSTIEEVIRSSKDNIQILKSGQINFLESSQVNQYPAYLEDPNFSNEKKSINSKIPSSVYSGDNQFNSSQLNLQKQFHHTIKTVASKQMPKCFRMSKHQLQIIQRQNNKFSGNFSHNTSNKMLMIDGSQNKFDHTFVVTKSNPSNHRSSSNDARVSFNHENNPQYQTIQRSKIDFQTPVRTSNKLSLNIFNEENQSYQHKSSSDRLEIDKERMTPAFNARQSYKTKPI